MTVNANEATRRYRMSTTTVMVVAALIAIMACSGYGQADISSAIGCATKYRAVQITDNDVRLENAQVQALLQNDQILKLIEKGQPLDAVAIEDRKLNPLRKYTVEEMGTFLAPSAHVEDFKLNPLRKYTIEDMGIVSLPGVAVEDFRINPLPRVTIEDMGPLKAEAIPGQLAPAI